MPQWLIDLAKNWLMEKTTSGAAEEIRRQDPAAVVALQKYREGCSFMQIAYAYAAATQNKEDDEVVADLLTKPFNEVLPRLAGPLGAVRIPDGDGDPSNDVALSDVLARIVEKATEQ